MEISYPLLLSNITCPRSQMSNCNSHRGSTPVLKPIQPTIQWVLQLFSSVKCPQHKADHLPLLGDEIKNARSYVFMSSCFI
jgi:hypothetical protein